MAQLKDTVVTGNLNVSNGIQANSIQTSTIKIPTTSGGTTFGPGTAGQIIKSNGTTVYWADDSDSHYTTHLYIGTSSGSTKAATTNGNTYLIALDDTTVRDRVNLAGTNGVNISSDANNNISIKVDGYDYSSNKITLGTNMNLDINQSQPDASYAVKIYANQLWLEAANLLRTDRSYIHVGKETSAAPGTTTENGVNIKAVDVYNSFLYDGEYSYNIVRGYWYSGSPFIQIGTHSTDPDTGDAIETEDINLYSNNLYMRVSGQAIFSAESNTVEIGYPTRNNTINGRITEIKLYDLNGDSHRAFYATAYQDIYEGVNVGDSDYTLRLAGEDIYLESQDNIYFERVINNSVHSWSFVLPSQLTVGNAILSTKTDLVFEGDIPANERYDVIDINSNIVPTSDISKYMAIVQVTRVDSSTEYFPLTARLTASSTNAQIYVYRQTADSHNTGYKVCLIKYC